MKAEWRLAIAVLSATLAAVSVAGSVGAARSHVVFHATSQRHAWESRLFSWPGGKMNFRADMNCTALGGPPLRAFHARLFSRRGHLYADFNFRCNGSAGTVQGIGQELPAGRYRLRVTTECTWAPWQVTTSAYTR